MKRTMFISSGRIAMCLSSPSVPTTRRLGRFKASNLRRYCRRADRFCISKDRPTVRRRTSQETRIDLVGAQDDSMAAGARKAFAEIAEGERERWLKIPFTGCDGLPKTGQAWIRNGLLAATIYIRPNTDLALEMLTEAIRTGTQPPERRLTVPESLPSIEELADRAAKTKSGKHRSAGA